METCGFEGCESSATKSGYCERHYRQMRRKGAVGWDGTVCASDPCEKPALARGLCERHYQRALLAEAPHCVIAGCEQNAFARGWCQKHYTRWRKHGDPLAWKRRVRGSCSVDACDHRPVSGGLCQMHLRRIKRYGTTELPPKPQVVIASPGVCRQCGGDIAIGSRRSKFCTAECAEVAAYWERRRNHRDVWLKRYGITVAQYEELLDRQGNRCAICQADAVPTRGSWCVDHCHKTGEVRGLLCTNCNNALGKFGDDIAILRAAIRYLQRPPGVR